jgi:outer membrane lipoprotein-sorting protein
MNDLHHNCELWAEPISLLAAGCLSTDEERDVRRHFETCPDCRERFGQLTQLCGALAEARLPVNVAEIAIVERVMSAVASEESRRPLVRTQAEMIQPSLLTRSLDNWRCIMRSPVSRIAAAAILVLAITGVALFFPGSGATFAFDDFAARILEAKTVKCKMIIETKGPPARTITSEMMTLGGTRMRQVAELPDMPKFVMIEDFSQGKSLTLVPASKTATLITSAKNGKDKTPESGGLFTLFRLFQLVKEKPGAVEHESLGEKEIDGRKVVGFHVSSQPHDLILWGDPKTGLPVRIEMTSGMEGSVKTTFSDFVFNVDTDESLFSLEPPAGYTVRNAKTDHSPEEEKVLIEMFREYSELFDGAFPDSLDFLTTATIAGKKAGLRMSTQKMWEDLAPGKGKPNEEQMRKVEVLMLKLTEGKPNKEQIKEIAEQMKEYVETQTRKTAEGGEVQAQETEEVRQARFHEIQQRVQSGLNFVYRLSPNADAHYVGKGVSFGAADTPIFWYRPKDSKNYRVIYADLSARDADTPPNVPNAQPVPAKPSPKQ